MKGFLMMGMLLFCTAMSFGQEEIGPLTGNPQLMAKGNKSIQKINTGTFDSTFIYTSDTISLPVFDDFSTSKFQTYNAGYTDPGVTSTLEYALLTTSDVPLPANTVYTTQVTFKRTYVVSTSTYTDVNFPATTIKVGSLASYPVTHVTTPVYPPYYVYDTVNSPGGTDASPDTIWISGPDILQDSARQFFAPVNDPELIWLDRQAFHNYTYAVNPWSLGVATFDGLDEFGYPYDFNSTTTNYADRLTSKPINMAGITAADSVYFSFLYQSKGLGDQPEPGDSLVLEFFAPELLQWNRVWGTNGQVSDNFKVGHLRIDNADYFKKGFQFRFKNYGGLSGSLDHFHIDYVNLRTISGQSDTLFKDFAFVYPITTLLKDFTSVPWDHWKNNFAGKMADNVQIVVRNGSNIPENNQNGSVDVRYGGTLEGSFVLPAQTLSGGNINYAPRTTYYSFHDFSAGYSYDETKLGEAQTFDIEAAASAQFANLTLNDSTFSKQVFENYYAYDDGSAEAAYGPTGVQARLAIKYTPYEADSLIGVKIHWVPSVNDVSNNLFLITVWGDNNGQPGAVLYEDEFFFPREPNYEFDRNLFTTYYLKDTMKLPINGTFYVGWRQFDADRLNVGLDLNIVNSDKIFYSIDGGNVWTNTTFQGSAMIRPVFSTSLDYTLGIQPKEMELATVTVYPNPTTGDVFVKTSMNVSRIEVYNLQGAVVAHSDSNRVSLSEQPAGVYFLRLEGDSRTFKVIKQ